MKARLCSYIAINFFLASQFWVICNDELQSEDRQGLYLYEKLLPLRTKYKRRATKAGLLNNVHQFDIK